MADDFPWEDLLDYIEQGTVAPIIGHELIEAEYEGHRVSLQQLLAERLAEREKVSVAWTRHFELNDAVCAYLARPQAKLAGLSDRLASMLQSLSPPFPIPEPLLQLAEITPLDFFVTLTFDSLMARALDQVRFDGDAMTKEVEFSINKSTTAYNEALHMHPGEAPSVFSLFGRAGSRSDFAIHDEDALEFVHRFVSGDAPPPDWVLNALRNRHLLVLGVHLPEWLGRFVLRAATRDRLRLAQRAYFIAAENAPIDAALMQFLQRFGRETSIAVFPGTAAQFVGELHGRWLERHPEPERAFTATRAPEIFISYGKESRTQVERLNLAIESLGGETWFDRQELEAGTRWEQDILQQIQRDVRLFVPVISLDTARRSEGYVFREWREAIERAKQIVGRRFIVPIVVDADFNGDLDRYANIMNEFPSFRQLHVGRAPDGEPDAALRETLVREIREIRRQAKPAL